ncbi:p-glycoprotein 5 [Mucor ambiguus]|uniref:p-glycoprotein 5 n=1 Tax=Mucor ambiguus TaxID=91626 RepID=A0A0C9LYX9_9FUNG|nr:p-glycoprotein 5 [Mucor ambiguus]
MSLLQLPANLSAVSSAYGAAYKFFTTIDRVSEVDTDAQDGEIPNCIGDFIRTNGGFRWTARLWQVDYYAASQKFFGSLGGTVTLGGHDLKSLNVKWLRQNINVVASLAQHEYSLQPRRRELTDLSYQDIITAGKETSCHSLISQLPDDYNNLADEPGGMLSGGQKQRIAIVRALVRKAKLLLLNEEALNNILEEGGLTMITIIAHRLLTIQNANLICVANDGRMIEQGTHWELLSLEGIYAKLVKKQSLSVLTP